MSVMIRGGEMPKRHLFEAFVAIGDGQIVVKDLEKNKLFAGKIEEVRTPHGRLIDENELLRHKYGFSQTARTIIKSTKAVIEAEVSE